MPGGRRPFAAPLAPRDRHEPHRAATPLELFFDLVAVLAIAAAGVGLHHSLAEGHAVEGVLGFLCAFFAIWWAWMNYTWFSSAYDNDDSLFRILTLVIMAGALVLATGVPDFFGGPRLLPLGVSGYILMRIGMVLLWLRVAASSPTQRSVALRYALGIALVQVYWTLTLLAGPVAGALPFYPAFVVGVVLELGVPVWAELHETTPWHRHHIVERYGLMNMIVLGETLLAAVIATRAEIDAGAVRDELAVVAIAAVVTSFAMWWLYFTEDEQLASDANARAFVWGYGHFLIFAAGAAVGAGFAVQVDVLTEHAHLTGVVADLAVAIPVAVYLLGLWLVRDRFCLAPAARPVLLVAAVLALLTPFLPHSLASLAVLTVATVIVRGELACRIARGRA
ncbi:MAG TPA: low temperature requirement protein A [Amaricoccus sp.]|nr:low temperature requirement protein A [Amaricoccus sp.]